jgi:hypothetical protein
MAWGVMAVVAPVSSGPDALSPSAQTGWLLLSALYGITACTAATLSPCLFSHHTLLLLHHHHHHPVPPSLSLFSRVHVPALALRSSAFSPAATDRQKKSISSPPAPPYPLRPPPVLLRPPPLVTLCPHFCFVLRLHHNELCVTRPRRHARVCTSACENCCDR